MPLFVSIDKSNIWKKHVADELSSVYKKVGFRNPDGFDRLVRWKMLINGDDSFVEVYAKTKGRKQSPTQTIPIYPLEEVVIYGSYAVVRVDSETGMMMDLNGSDIEYVLNASVDRVIDYVSPLLVVSNVVEEEIAVAVEAPEVEIKLPVVVKKSSQTVSRKGKRSAAAITFAEELEETEEQLNGQTFLRCTNELTEENFIV